MVTPTIGTAVAPTAPLAPVQDEWWKIPGATGTPATTSAPAAYTPTKWDVSPDQTVEQRVGGIINADSPLMQRAAVRADQQSNRRGLMNSSMAVGAAQGAVMDAALPIAQQDAQTMARAGESNAAAGNRASEFNTNLATNVAMANTEAANTATLQQNTIKQQAAANNAAAAADMAKVNLDNQFKASMVNADAQTKLALTQLDGEVKTNLANIDADYRTLIQTSASASAQYNTTVEQVGRIVQNPEMTAESKTAAINGLFNRLGVAMNLIGSINGVDMQGLLDFGTVTRTPG